MAIKLIDVARLANVSRSTASNVFSNPARVRPAVRAKVAAAAEALGYGGPNPRGRLLRSGKVNSIAVVAPRDWGVDDSMRNPVFAQFLRGVAQACDQAGASLVIVPDKHDHKGVASALVDGFIFGRIEHMNQLDPARLRKLPFAVVDFNAGPEINSVMVDARAGARTAAEHLIGLGHRRFGILSFLRGAGTAKLYPPGEGRDPSMAGMPLDQDKLAGYAEALAGAGVRIDDVPVVQADPWDSGAAPLMLDAAPDATAFLSMSVMQALALVKEAQRRGMNVPGDISVIGFNDSPEATLSNPPLTTIDSRIVEKGRIAAALVLAGEHGKQHILQPHLLTRGTTAPPKR